MTSQTKWLLLLGAAGLIYYLRRRSQAAVPAPKLVTPTLDQFSGAEAETLGYFGAVQTNNLLMDQDAAALCRSYGGEYRPALSSAGRSKCYQKIGARGRRVIQLTRSRDRRLNLVPADAVAVAPGVAARDSSLPLPQGMNCPSPFRYFVLPNGREACMRPCSTNCPGGEVISESHHDAYGWCGNAVCAQGAGGGDAGGGSGGGE